jgi:Flp pilus assembly protein protease CpaA
MIALHLGVLVYFAISISVEDLRMHKIRNRKLLYFLSFLTLFSFVQFEFRVTPMASFQFLGIFIALYLLSNAIHKLGGIGFGDVKLIAVLAFGYFETGLRSIEIFFVALWIALMAHICLYLLMYRKYPHRIAMAPDIFLASGLYMYAPIELLLPQ